MSNEIARDIAERKEQNDKMLIESLHRLEIPRNLIASGKAMEAAEYAKERVGSLPEFDLRVLVGMLADAILQPTPRKRGDKFANRQTIQKLHNEIVLSRAVAVDIEKKKKQPRRNAKPVISALEGVGKNPKNATSVGSAKRAYYKHKR